MYKVQCCQFHISLVHIVVYELALRLAKNLNLQGLMLHNKDWVLDRDWMTAKVRQ